MKSFATAEAAPVVARGRDNSITTTVNIADNERSAITADTNADICLKN